MTSKPKRRSLTPQVAPVARFAVILGGALLCVPARGDDTAPVDRFLASLDADSALPADATDLIRKTWAECRNCDADEFLTQGLALLSPKLRQGLDAYDAERYGQCAGIMDELRSDANPFVAVHAAAYEIKALVAMDRLLEAGQLIEEILARPAGGEDRTATYSYLAPEISFLHGFCLLADLRYGEAEDALLRFLRRYPDTSQRLLMAARQMLAELENRQPGQIGEIVDLMDFAGRRLTHGHTGQPVQGRQERIVDLLDRLIEEAEEQENSSSNSSSSGGGGGGSSGGPSPSTPMQDSQLPGGQAAEGALQAGRRANPGDVWGAMPPDERERILQALRDNFPSRYRQLVEQYYEHLGKRP